MTPDAGAVAPAAIQIPRWAVTAFVTIAGLLFGSFLNVVIYRVPRRLSVVRPNSFCPHCDTPVRPVDNIPVLSWLMLRGRCHTCRGRISVRYPLVELATALIFAAVGWGLGAHWDVAGFCVLAATLVALVAIERDGLALPLSVAAIGTALAALLLVGAAAADHRWHHVVGMAIGALVAAVVIALKAPRTKSAPALLPVGVVLGWLGPVAAAEGLGTAAVVLVVTRVIGGRATVPGSGEETLALAVAAGAVVALVVAVAAGTGAAT
jgi:leader peptidase (prepilin peptidase)/N-methyltransferase